MTKINAVDRDAAALIHMMLGGFSMEPAARSAADKGSLSRMVEELVLSSAMPYAEIVAAVKGRFPDASTSTKSVASVACVMRAKGKAVPYRLKLMGA